VPPDRNGSAGASGQHETDAGEDVYILRASHAQQRMWFFSRLAGDSSLYSVPRVLWLRGTVDAEALQHALNVIVARHEILRTTFRLIDGELMQVIAAASHVPLPVTDVPASVAAAATPDATQVPAFHQLILDQLRPPFDLAAGPLLRAGLLRVGPADHVLVACFHHIIMDGWSMGIFAAEISAIYSDVLASRPSVLPELAIQYADYAEWQQETLTGDALASSLSYWRSRLHGAPSAVELPTDRPRPQAPSFRGACHRFGLPAELSRAIRKYCGDHEGVTVFMTLLAGFCALLSRYSGQADILVGTPVAGRSTRQVEPLIGMFVNTLVLRADLTADPGLSSLVDQLRETCVDAYDHQDLPFDKLVEDLAPARDPRLHPLFQVIFALQNAAQVEVDLPGARTIPVRFDVWQSRFDLELHIRDEPDQFTAEIVYSTDLFESATIARMAEHLCCLLQQALATPELPVSSISLLTKQQAADIHPAVAPAQQSQLVATVPALFEAQAGRTPAVPALACGDGVIGYAELRSASLRLAAWLVAAGLRPGTRVGVRCANGRTRVLAMLAVLQSGCVYVGADASEPAGAGFLAAAGAGVILASPGDLPAPDSIRVIDADAALAESAHAGAAAPAVPSPSGRSPALVVWSADGPLQISHGALCHSLRSMQDALPLTGGDTVLQVAPPELAAAAVEVLWPLLHGASVAAADATEAGPVHLQRLAARHAATTAFVSPAQLVELSEAAASGERNGQQVLGGLRRVLCASGPLPQRLVNTFLARFDGELFYLYGPPEACGLAAMTRCAAALEGGDVPLAGGVGVTPHVLDGAGRPVPAGVVGEICLSGPGLAGEYLRSAAATGARFGTLPANGERMFRTGERGRRRADGRIEFVGRHPSRAWAGGYQADLGAIRAAVLAAGPVHDCEILPRLTTRGAGELVAAVVPADGLAPEQLAASLRATLPAALVPRAFLPVSTVWSLRDGRPALQALDELPVLDDGLVTSWQRRLAGTLGEGMARTEIAETSVPQARLHLHDVTDPGGGRAVAVPDPRPAASAADGGPPPVTGTPAAGGRPPPRAAPAADGGSGPVPATADGGPPPEAGFQTLTEALLHAAECADGTIVHVDSTGAERRQSYGALLADARRVLGGLREAGVAPGDRVILQLAGTADYVTGFWACMLGGIVPAPLAVPAGYAEGVAACTRVEATWRMLGRPWVLAAGADAAALRRHGDARQWEGLRVAALDQLRGHEPDQEAHACGPDDAALMLLTSGSTGNPKAVVQRHRSIIAQCAASIQRFGLTAADASFNWMPLDHVGGIVMFHIRDVMLGCTQVHAPTQAVLAEPLRWLDWADRYHAVSTWAPNFAFGLVVDQLDKAGGRSWDLSRLRLIINGGEAVIARVGRNFLRALAPHGLPAGAIHPAWGMSETASAVTYSDSFTLLTTQDDDAFVEVGPPVNGVRMRILDGEGAVLPEGTPGRLQVTGSTLTAGYDRNPDANSDAFTADGWFDTGDLAYLRGGSLTITGRVKDVIIVNGINYHCHEIESAVEELDCVDRSYTAACMVRPPAATTDQLAIFFHLVPGTDQAAALRRIRRAVAGKVGITADYLIPVGQPDIPKTEIGKLQRPVLRQRFESGDYTAALRRADLLLEAPSTLPQWFYRPTWHHYERDTDPGIPLPASTLILLDRAGLGQRLAAELRRAGHRCLLLRAEPGTQIRRLGQDSYQLDPADPQQYLRLLRAAAGDGFTARCVLHLGGYAPYRGGAASLHAVAAAQLDGAISLRHLLTAVAAVRPAAGQVDLYAAGSHTQQAGDADVVACERATVLGLINSAPQELPWLHCRHVDLPMDSIEADAGRVLREVRLPERETEVCYRGGRRLVSRLTPVDLTPRAAGDGAFREGGLYVITGGLGEVGMTVASHLAGAYRARVLLLGRSGLPEDTGAPVWAGPAGPQAGSLQALRGLRAVSADVAYAAVDLCDEQQIRTAIGDAERRWGTRASAVMHLAGRFQQRPVLDLGQDDFAEVIAPKVYGAWTLSRALRDRPDTRLLFFSSVNGYFGGALAGAYAAANRFLDAYALQLSTAAAHGGRPRCQSLAWSMWDELGISRGYQLKQRTRQGGYHILTPREGLVSLEIAAGQAEPVILIGVDPAGSLTRPRIADEPRPLQRLIATTAAGAAQRAVAKLAGLTLPDRYGRPSMCDIIDAAATAAPGIAGPARGRAAYVEPESQYEKVIAEIWRDVLRRDRIGCSDNFFDLGGTSLQLTVAHDQLCRTLRREVAVTDLFRYPTVGTLAQFLTDGSDEQGTDAGTQRGAMRKQARREREERGRRRRQDNG
jgi:acyl-CoA synthetase (AMP-forming)/AMP-acid ligase II